MSKYITYPDKQRLRRQSKLACRAIQDLATLGIEVLSVKFRRTNPKIEVCHCPGTRKIKSALNGQGVNNLGQKYITRSTIFSGCQVEWQEVKNG